MVTSVLVPFDGTDEATGALKHALSTYPNAAITVLYVAGSPTPMMGEAVGLAVEDDTQEAVSAAAKEVFESARTRAEAAGVEIETAVDAGKPGPSIVDHAAAYDHVVVGEHGGSLAETFLTGNVTKHVVRNSPVPVTVV